MNKYFVIALTLGILTTLCTIPITLPNNPFWGFWQSEPSSEKYCEGNVEQMSFLGNISRYDYSRLDPCGDSAFHWSPSTYSFSAEGGGEYELMFTHDDTGSHYFSATFLTRNSFTLDGTVFKRLSVFEACWSYLEFMSYKTHV